MLQIRNDKTPRFDWRHYESYEEALEVVQDRSKQWEKAANNSLALGQRESFYGTKNMEEAIELAVNGWPAGVKQISDGLSASVSASGMERAPVLDMNVGGAYPIAAVAAAGDPMCMVDVGDVGHSARPVLDILVSVTTSAFVRPEQIMNYGTAIAANIDRLENAGCATNLSIGFFSSFGGTHAFNTISVKRSTQALELDRLAFMIGHPSSQRRIFFNLLESMVWTERKYRGTYGSVCTPTREMLPDRTAYVPGANAVSERELDDPVRATAAATKQFNAAIKDVYGEIARVHYDVQ